MIALTPDQVIELRRYAHGRPRHPSTRPNRNLIRRNMLTLAPARGHGWYRITEYGQEALAERGSIATTTTGGTMTATPWIEPTEPSHVEIVRATEGEIADAIVTGEFVPARLPYHFPSCATGTCAGCDAQAGVEAVQVMHGAS